MSENKIANCTTREIPITREIDGFKFILQSVHVESVSLLEKEIKKRDMLLNQACLVVTTTIPSWRDLRDQFLKDFKDLKKDSK